MSNSAFSPSLTVALSQLKKLNIPWFDDNPAAWDGPAELLGHPPSDWDYFRILDYAFIGDASGRIGTKLDVKPRVGGNGSTLTMNGQKDTVITVKLYFFTPMDLVAYIQTIRKAFNISNFTGTVLRKLTPPTVVDVSQSPAFQDQSTATTFYEDAKTTNAIVVSNPRLAIHQRTQLYLEEVSLVEPPRDGRPAMAELKLHQFLASQLGGAAIAVTPEKAIAANLPGVPATGNLVTPKAVILPGTHGGAPRAR